MNVFIDIETIPDQSEGALQEFIDNVKAPASYKKQESIDKWLSENKEAAGKDAWLKTSFDGARGEIVSIAFAVNDSETVVFSRGLHGKSEADLLMRFNNELCESLDLRGHIQSPYFIGHNLKKFDLPFLFKRMVINGVKPDFKLKAHGRHGADMYDTMEAWAGFNGSISMDSLAKALGVQSKTEGMDGSKVWPEIEAGNHEKVAEYNMQDVEVTRNIYDKLNFL